MSGPPDVTQAKAVVQSYLGQDYNSLTPDQQTTLDTSMAVLANSQDSTSTATAASIGTELSSVSGNLTPQNIAEATHVSVSLPVPGETASSGSPSGAAPAGNPFFGGNYLVAIDDSMASIAITAANQAGVQGLATQKQEVGYMGATQNVMDAQYQQGQDQKNQDIGEMVTAGIGMAVGVGMAGAAGVAGGSFSAAAGAANSSMQLGGQLGGMGKSVVDAMYAGPLAQDQMNITSGQAAQSIQSQGMQASTTAAQSANSMVDSSTQSEAQMNSQAAQNQHFTV